MAARVLYINETGGEEGRFGDVREYTRRFVAKVSSLDGAIRALRLAAPKLQRWQPHPQDEAAFVTSFDPAQRDNSKIFDITVEYSSANEEPEDPLAMPAEISWETTEITRVVTQDRKGNPVVNTAGSLLLDVQEELGILVCRIEKNVAAVPKWFKSYANSVNSDAPRIDGFVFDPRTGLLKRWKLGKREVQADVPFRRLEMEILHREDTWDRKILNRGLYEVEYRLVQEKSGLKTKQTWRRDLVHILNDKDEPVTEPQFLDENGRRPRLDYVTDKPVTDPKGIGYVKTPIDPSEIHVLTFETKNVKPFSALPIR